MTNALFLCSACVGVELAIVSRILKHFHYGCGSTDMESKHYEYKYKLLLNVMSSMILGIVHNDKTVKSIREQYVQNFVL